LNFFLWYALGQMEIG